MTNPPETNEGRVFTAWMLGCAIVVGNLAFLFGPLVFVGSVVASWVAISVSLCMFRTQRRVLLGLLSVAVSVWPWIYSNLLDRPIPSPFITYS